MGGCDWVWVGVTECGWVGKMVKPISKIFFQMSVRVYSVPGQNEGRRKAFLEWKSIDLSSKLSLTCGGYFNCYKSVHHPIPTRGNKEHRPDMLL